MPSALASPRPPVLTAAQILEQLLTMNQADPPSFAELLERLYAAKFQGPVVLHFAGGLPRTVEFPQPVKMTLGT